MYDDTAVDSAKITVIATGLNDATAKQASVSKASADVYKRQVVFLQPVHKKLPPYISLSVKI